METIDEETLDVEESLFWREELLSSGAFPVSSRISHFAARVTGYLCIGTVNVILERGIFVQVAFKPPLCAFSKERKP